MSERLTKKDKITTWYKKGNYVWVDISLYEKLQALEDIEEGLGIDLLTLFAGTKKVFVKSALNGIIEGNITAIDFIFNAVTIACGTSIYRNVAISRYGEFWALTKEELVK